MPFVSFVVNPTRKTACQSRIPGTTPTTDNSPFVHFVYFVVQPTRANPRHPAQFPQKIPFPWFIVSFRGPPTCRPHIHPFVPFVSFAVSPTRKTACQSRIPGTTPTTDKSPSVAYRVFPWPTDARPPNYPFVPSRLRVEPRAPGRETPPCVANS